MSQQQRLCPGKGHRCQAFMAPLTVDPHSLCARCNQQECTEERRCRDCRECPEDVWKKYLALLARRRSRRKAKSLSDSGSAPDEQPAVTSVSSTVTSSSSIVPPPIIDMSGVRSVTREGDREDTAPNTLSDSQVGAASRVTPPVTVSVSMPVHYPGWDNWQHQHWQPYQNYNPGWGSQAQAGGRYGFLPQPVPLDYAGAMSWPSYQTGTGMPGYGQVGAEQHLGNPWVQAGAGTVTGTGTGTGTVSSLPATVSSAAVTWPPLPPEAPVTTVVSGPVFSASTVSVTTCGGMSTFTPVSASTPVPVGIFHHRVQDAAEYRPWQVSLGQGRDHTNLSSVSEISLQDVGASLSRLDLPSRIEASTNPPEPRQDPGPSTSPRDRSRSREGSKDRKSNSKGSRGKSSRREDHGSRASDAHSSTSSKRARTPSASGSP